MRTILFLVVTLQFSCQAPQSNESYTQQDSLLMNVFKPWDGRWKGKFYVYSDSFGQTNLNNKPAHLNIQTLDSMSLSQDLVIEVEQYYQSQNPFFQSVTIKDTYPGTGGEQRVEESKGYNQVKDGKISCMVNKPNEEVIHIGEKINSATLIWQRSLNDPLKKEYFREYIENDKYIIIGWGYYGADDTTRNPRTWFYGEYLRVNDD